MSDLERTSQLENEAINAMSALMAEHDYSKADLENLVSVAIENAA